MLRHIPVLLKEMLEMLSPKDGGIYFDGTFGGGGYTTAILDKANCRVIASDRDLSVRNMAKNISIDYGERFDFFHEKFSNIKLIMELSKVKKFDGIVLDLGVSCFQLVDSSRGFSFNFSGPIDMKMGLCKKSALDVIQKYSEKDLADIIYEFGEEHFSRRIAKSIKLNLKKIITTTDLANIVRSCVKKRGRIDSATKTFQALRIFVNDELGELKKILTDSVNLLNPLGSVVVVSFHSLEDRIVKFFFKNLVLTENSTKFKLLTKKPIVPSKEEILFNPKSRSAKLRGISMLQ